MVFFDIKAFLSFDFGYHGIGDFVGYHWFES